MKDVWKKWHISREAKVGMYEGIIEHAYYMDVKYG